MFYRPVKTRQRPWTRHYYLLCDLRKTCFGVQLSGFPFCTTYLSDAIGQVQKRALAIIYPNINYAVSLDLSRILKLSDWRLKACDKLFNDIVTTPSHNLGHLLPERHSPRYNLRQTRVFVPPRAKTCRFTNTFIPSWVAVYNESWYINYELYFQIDLAI